MKIKNISPSPIDVHGVLLQPGQNSAEIDNAITREIIEANHGLLCFAPEGEQDEQELAGADQKHMEPGGSALTSSAFRKPAR